MCCRISKLGVAQGSGVTRAWPTRWCCEHTHVCLRTKTHSFKVAPKDQRLYGVGRRTAAVSIHMCVWQNHTSTQGLHQGSNRYKSAAVSIHMCVWQNHMSTQGLHQGSKRYKSLADQLLLRAYTYMFQKQFQVAPKDHRLHGTGRPTARICQVKVAPKGQGPQVFGRPRVAVSIHMCVAK